MMKHLVFVALAAVLLLGCTQVQTQPGAGSVPTQKNAVAAPSDAMKKDASAPVASPVATDGLTGTPSSPAMGQKAVYVPFTQASYDAARTAGKLIFLEFYANWCPTCKQQEPQIEAAFQKGIPANVAGYRVNYNDDETDENEKNLARQFGVSYQHTHVILDGAGSVKTKSLEFWSSDMVAQEIQKVAG
ncbi:redoxin domain-containing protein [Candidatus Micrarchaeota archaeon]|nr:redoxin domain-containing protein [Candidatus Micrarchaeota archaeon]